MNGRAPATATVYLVVLITLIWLITPALAPPALAAQPSTSPETTSSEEGTRSPPGAGGNAQTQSVSGDNPQTQSGDNPQTPTGSGTFIGMDSNVAIIIGLFLVLMAIVAIVAIANRGRKQAG